MANTIQRVKYYANQFLQVDDFTDEQSYHKEMRRRHNIVLHKWGIADGLEVKAIRAAAIMITKGAAIDANGCEILLPADDEKELSDFPDNAVVYVTIRYKEEEGSKSGQKGVNGNNRVTEKPAIELSNTAPKSPGEQILLAKVTLDGRTVLDQNIDTTGRQLAGVKSDDLTVQLLKFKAPTAEPSQWPQMSAGSDNKVAITGGLKVASSAQIDENVQIGSQEKEASLEVRGPLTARKINVKEAIEVEGIKEQCFSTEWFKVKPGGIWEIDNPLDEIPSGFQMYCIPKTDKDKEVTYLIQEGDRIPVNPIGSAQGQAGYMIKMSEKTFTIYTLEKEPIAGFIKKDDKGIRNWQINEGQYRFVFWKKKEFNEYHGEALKAREL